MFATISWNVPDENALNRLAWAQVTKTFTYAAVGATAAETPAGYVVDHNRIKLGEGEKIFRAACSALQAWKHFNLGWVKAVPLDNQIKVGGVVAVTARAFGLWWLNACRIVYVIDDKTESLTCYGFAYGTLPAHAETGEERFLIEWNRTTNEVFYDLLAFSKPHGVLSRLGNPWLRKFQKRFAEDSKAAMVRAVQSIQP